MTTQHEKITFTGSQGDQLAAKLDLPDRAPRAYAIFAHCFTCSKDIFAASRISGKLAASGIAVLRFDFTGLGMSEGEFANTNFSSNVADLVLAADFLREHYDAPTILIGHSLGGAAVLAAAEQVPEARAIATIGAPADIGHVAHNFGAKVDEINEQGLAEVTLGGRQFTIQKQFLDDISQQSLTPKIANLKKALLVFHAPLDKTVGINNAAEIFAAAKHPKSFVSLDDADHLLSRRADSIYVADVLNAWAQRYLKTDASTTDTKVQTTAEVMSVETGAGKFQQKIISGKHQLIADEPLDFGGLNSGPSPYDFISIGLAACTSMTLRMYAERKGLALENVSVEVNHAKVHAKDCAECEKGDTGRIDKFVREISLTGTLSPDERERLLEIADKCPVHKTLVHGAAVVSKLKP